MSLKKKPVLDGRDFPAYKAIVACLEAPVFEYNGARKIVQGVGFQLDAIPPVDLARIGYNPKVKMNALKRMYFNPDEAERVKSLLEHRKDQAFSAVAMSMRGGAKDRRSMGWCMESLVIGTTPKRTTAEVMYRSTEVIRKFTADLAYLPWVFEQLEVEPESVRFHFANAYLSGVFFPTLFLWWEPLLLLDRLRREEPKLFVVATRFLRRSVRTPDQRFPYSPENQQHQYAWANYPEKMREIHEFLEAYLA